MIQLAEGASTPKVRKRAAAKPSSRPQPERVKLTLYVSVETAQRLAVHATMGRMDRSALVEELIVANCRRYVIQDRGGATGETVAISEA